MTLLHQAYHLFRKDSLLEWRQKSSLAAVVLYVASVVFVIYLALTREQLTDRMDKATWNVLFWITLLFVAFQVVGKSFTQESRERFLYYYTIARPEAVILSKMMYNWIFMIGMSLVTALFFTLMIGQPIENIGLFGLCLILGAGGMAWLLTFIAAIASKTGNASVLLAVLGFPVMLPMLLLLQQLARFAYVSGATWNDWGMNALLILCLKGMILTLSLILFPYIWRD